LHVAKTFGTAQCGEYRLALLHAIVREIQILMFLFGMMCYNGIYLPIFSIDDPGKICNTVTYEYTTRFGTHRERQRSKDLNILATLIFKSVEWFECLRVKRETRVLF
jgi:hypothetical protein